MAFRAWRHYQRGRDLPYGEEEAMEDDDIEEADDVEGDILIDDGVGDCGDEE